jgi:hypothetical protein
MKTCKTGCGGKMKAGGSVKKVKKMADGGSTGLVGMPRYSNNPRSEQGRILKKGGSAKSKGCPPGYYWSVQGCQEKTPGYKKPFSSTGSKIGIGTTAAAVIGTVVKGISDKVKDVSDRVKAKKAEKEKTKKEGETSKAKFGASVGVKASCKQGMVRGADGNCVMSRPKFKSGGSLKPVPADKVGLAKLPTAVRNKMGFQKKGGSVKK